MSLLTAVQQAVYEIGSGNVPTFVVGNTDSQVLQLASFATREAREFAKLGSQYGSWPELRKEYTFTLNPVGPYTGTLTPNSTTISNLSSTAGLAAGYGISASGILTSASIVSVGVGSVVISEAPTVNSVTNNVSIQFGQTSYSLPSDFGFFIAATQWDRNFRWQMLGPLNAQEWQTIISGISPVGPRIRFRIFGNPLTFNIQPVPGQGQKDVIVFEYISNAICQSSAGVFQTAWQNDSDLYIWDDDLLTLGIIWRFKRAKGLDYTEERRMYDDRVAMQLSRSGGNRSLPLNASANGIRLLNSSNVPDTGFGT